MYNNNNGNQWANQQKQATAPGDVDPSKVRFSTIKLGETKQGSPTVGLYLKHEEAEHMYNILGEILKIGRGGKIQVVVMKGMKYDSGYAFVNPKEEQKQGGQYGGNQTQGGYNRQPQPQQGNFDNKSQARSFFQSKRVDDTGTTK